VRGRQAAVAILDAMKVLDQVIALARRVSQQRGDLAGGARIDLPALETVADALAKAKSLVESTGAVAYVPQAELAAIAEFDENIVKELRNRARDVLLTQAIASEETLDQSMPADDLLLLEGMSPDLALALARRGVRTREDLADQAVDDLSDIEGLTAEEAGKLIMTARAPWFDAGHRGE